MTDEEVSPPASAVAAFPNAVALPGKDDQVEIFVGLRFPGKAGLAVATIDAIPVSRLFGG